MKIEYTEKIKYREIVSWKVTNNLKYGIINAKMLYYYLKGEI